MLGFLGVLVLSNYKTTIMKKEEFIELLVEELEIESVADVLPTTKFKELEEWDSMGHIILISLVDENFEKKLTTKEIESFNIIADIINFIGNENFA